MRDRKRIWVVAGISTAVLLTALVLLITAGAVPKRQDTQDKENAEVSAAVPTEASSEEEYPQTVKVAEGSVFLPENGRKLIMFGREEYFFDLYVSLGLYEEARTYARNGQSLLRLKESYPATTYISEYTALESKLALLEQLGPSPEKPLRQKFEDLPEKKQEAILKAFAVLEELPIHSYTPQGVSYLEYTVYEGTFGDDCQIFSDDWHRHFPRDTTDILDDYAVGEFLIPCFETIFYVYRQNEWMGLNIAYERGFLTLNDLRALVYVRAFVDSSPGNPRGSFD